MFPPSNTTVPPAITFGPPISRVPSFNQSVPSSMRAPIALNVPLPCFSIVAPPLSTPRQSQSSFKPPTISVPCPATDEVMTALGPDESVLTVSLLPFKSNVAVGSLSL